MLGRLGIFSVVFLGFVLIGDMMKSRITATAAPEQICLNPKLAGGIVKSMKLASVAGLFLIQG